MSLFLIKNARVVNEGNVFYANVLIKDNFIEKIFHPTDDIPDIEHIQSIDAKGKSREEKSNQWKRCI